MESTFYTIKRIIVALMYIEPSIVKPESRVAHDLGADSLDKVEIIMHVEKKFEIAINDDFEYNTVQDLVDFIDTHKK